MNHTAHGESIVQKWIDKAESILKDYQEKSIYWDLYFTSQYGLSNEVERGTLQTMTKVMVSIAMVVVMLVFSLHENSYWVSIQLCKLNTNIFLYTLCK